jgi:hypothetical protein
MKKRRITVEGGPDCAGAGDGGGCVGGGGGGGCGGAPPWGRAAPLAAQQLCQVGPRPGAGAPRLRNRRRLPASASRPPPRRPAPAGDRPAAAARARAPRRVAPAAPRRPDRAVRHPPPAPRGAAPALHGPPIARHRGAARGAVPARARAVGAVRRVRRRERRVAVRRQRRRGRRGARGRAGRGWLAARGCGRPARALEQPTVAGVASVAPDATPRHPTPPHPTPPPHPTHPAPPPPPQIRSIFLNRLRGELLTVSCHAADGFRTLRCRAVPLRWAACRARRPCRPRRQQLTCTPTYAPELPPTASATPRSHPSTPRRFRSVGAGASPFDGAEPGALVFASERISYPGFFEFDDSNGKALVHNSNTKCARWCPGTSPRSTCLALRAACRAPPSSHSL